ncbi:MAG: M23 family metallopeptidase [Rickettsiales bacterium]|jgi:murein DD-endopeptidase MepM/ murein hydrolase activator NlpD|nr:M23 family metallopeptidase [Rickettsiales bacterium]
MIGKKVKNFLKVERKIIYISNEHIKFKKISICFLVWNLLFVFWVSFSSIGFFLMHSAYINNEYKIIKLQREQHLLFSHIYILKNEVESFSNFVTNLNKYDRLKNIENNINKNIFIDNDNNKFIVLDRVKKTIKNVNKNFTVRTRSIEKLKNRLNLDNNKQIEYVSFENKDIEYLTNYVDKNVMESIVIKKDLYNNIDKLQSLEEFLNELPLYRPIHDIIISSQFGERVDPFSGKIKSHYGIDLAGPLLTKIFAPAEGKVIFTGMRGGYGNVLVLEHKNKIKTMYGHLNNFLVKIGDEVKRGQIIAVQGSTGKSTGAHLHYEIIKNKQIVNPSDFLREGEKIF